MGEIIEIVGGPELEERNLPEEGKYFEITWELNQTPEENWQKRFDSLLKPWLEKEDILFGPFKPKIIFTQLITTLKEKENLEKQKEFFIKEFIQKSNI